MCQAIETLKKRHEEKLGKAITYQTTTTVKDKAKLIDLVGDRCIIDCRLQKKSIQVLLDAGAQVSTLNHQYLSDIHPALKIRDK